MVGFGIIKRIKRIMREKAPAPALVKTTIKVSACTHMN